MADLRFLRSGVFWMWSVITLVFASIFFAWELQLIHLPLPMIPRMETTTFDLTYTVVLSLLLALAAGLFGWQRRFGVCPVGVKRTFGFAGTLGGIALLCPVCLVLPGALLGLSTIIAVVGQFLPLIRLLAIMFAVVAVYLLWPRRVSAPKKAA